MKNFLIALTMNELILFPVMIHFNYSSISNPRWGDLLMFGLTLALAQIATGWEKSDIKNALVRWAKETLIMTATLFSCSGLIFLFILALGGRNMPDLAKFCLISGGALTFPLWLSHIHQSRTGY